MLPLVQSIASDIAEVFRCVTGRRSDLHRLIRSNTRSAGTLYDDEIAESRADLQAEYDQIWKYREELESLGVYLRHPEGGAIDFPTIMSDQEAYFCWQLGEKSIQYWREAKSPNSPKQLLPSLEKA